MTRCLELRAAFFNTELNLSIRFGVEAGAISQLNRPNRILLHDSGRGLGGGGGFLLGLDFDFNGDSDLGDEDISLSITIFTFLRISKRSIRVFEFRSLQLTMCVVEMKT